MEAPRTFHTTYCREMANRVVAEIEAVRDSALVVADERPFEQPLRVGKVAAYRRVLDLLEAFDKEMSGINQ